MMSTLRRGEGREVGKGKNEMLSDVGGRAI